MTRAYVEPVVVLQKQRPLAGVDRRRDRRRLDDVLRVSVILRLGHIKAFSGMDVSLYGDLMDEKEREAMIHAVSDPLHGETFSLQAYISKRGGVEALPIKRAMDEYSAASGQSTSYAVKSNPVFFGIPPAIYGDKSPHEISATIVAHSLPLATCEAEVRRLCAESIGAVRVIRMLIDDTRTGMFNGTAVIEFIDATASSKAIAQGILGGKIRSIRKSEFEELTTGPFPGLDLGPIDYQLQNQIAAGLV